MRPGRPVQKRAKFNGKKLRLLRIQRGLSARAVGQAVGMAETSIRHTEQCRTRPSPEVVAALAALFNVSPAAFRI